MSGRIGGKGIPENKRTIGQNCVVWQ